MEYDDSQLKSLLQNPKTRREGFDKAVRQYSEQLYWQVRRIVLTHEDSDDVLQNAFLKAWTSLDNFKGEAKFITWLTRIAINESLDFVRRKKTRAIVSSDEEDTGIANRLIADSYFDGNEIEAQLQEAIAKLPDAQRTVFLFRYFDEMKYSEISQILGTSEGGLKASYHIAVKKITDFFHHND